MMRNSSKKLSIYCMIGCMWYSGFIYCNSNFMSNKLVVIVPVVAVACKERRKRLGSYLQATTPRTCVGTFFCVAYRQPHREEVSKAFFLFPSKLHHDRHFWFLLSPIHLMASFR